MRLIFLLFLAYSLISSSPQRQAVPDAPPLPTHVVFDLLALRKLTIAQIRERLGQPNADDREPDPDNYMMAGRWHKTYRREGIELRIDYIVKTGKVMRFYLSTVAGAFPETALSKFLAIGHLSQKNSGFMIKPVFVHQDSSTHRYVDLVLTPVE